MIRLDLPLTRQTADEQLNFSSEMVSIDEFESRAEEEPHQLF